MTDWDNQTIAAKLRELADLLEQQQASPFRVNAYRRAARTIAGRGEALSPLVEREGLEGLERLPGIGRSIALAIEEMLRTGSWLQLERLRGSLDPEQVFRSIPGVGPELAKRIHDALEVETLAGLELAAHDGRLEQVPGVGPRRSGMISAGLAQILRTRPTRGARLPWSRRSRCCSTSTASTGKRRRRVTCARLRHGVSIRTATRGFRSFTLSATTGISRHCFRIRHGRMNSQRPTTG